LGRGGRTSWQSGSACLLSAFLVSGVLSSAVAEPAQALGLPAILVSITVSPATRSIAAGQTEQFTATGTYSNLSTKDLTSTVTWSSCKSATATIAPLGLATGVANGVVTITATDPSTLIHGTALLTVTQGLPAPTIAMTPSSGAKRTPVTVHGTSFAAGQTVTIIYMSGRKRPKRASTVVCAATVAADGTFTCNGAIPKRARADALGQKTVTGAASGGTLTSTTFNLT